MTQQTSTAEDTLTQFILSADRLVQAVKDLSETELDLAHMTNGWTIRQVVHHVADDGDAWSMPLKKALATPGAPIRFEGFPGNEAWANALAFHKRPIQNSLALLKAHRQVMAELASYFVDVWDCRYVTIIDSAGKEVQKVTVGQIINMVTEHMLEHADMIETIKKENNL